MQTEVHLVIYIYTRLT